MTNFKILLFAGAAMLPAIPAFAQAEEKDDIVVLGAGVEQASDESGRAITTIDRAELETRQTTIVSDLLATLPGVGVTRNGGIGTISTVRIRGAEGEQTLVLIDGVRVNDPSSPGGAFDFANLLAGPVDRVEVLRGPNSVAWGSQAVGGVVNIVTAQTREGFGARANAEYGSLNQISLNGGVSGGNETFEAAITGGYFDTDGISAAANGTEADGYRQYGATGKLKINFAPGFAFDVRGYFSDSRADLDGFPAPNYTLADTPEYSTSKEVYGYAGLTADLLDGRFHNSLNVTIADIDRDNYDPTFGSAPSFFGRGNSERYAYQGDFRVIDQVRLVFGAEQEDSSFTDGGPKYEQGITSFYGEAIVSPIEQVTLTAGLRNDDHSGFGSHTSFGASAAVRPFEGTVLRASYGEGFKAPTLYQRFSFYGTSGLQPETAKSYEFGAQQTLGPVTIGATWFHRDTVNQIDFDLGTFTYQNIAKTRGEGIELELVAKPVAGLTLRGAFTHLDAENRSPGANLGKDLARRPKDSGSFSADYKFDFGLSLGGTVLVVGESFDNLANTVRLDGYALVGLRAEFPVTDQVVLYGRVDNVFDESYQTVAGYGTYGRTAYAGVRLKLD
jgi:vitamin B12 transporter